MFQTMPSMPVPALVIPAVSGPMAPVLPSLGEPSCPRPFNHECSAAETIPKGTGGSISWHSKRAYDRATPGTATGLQPACADQDLALIFHDADELGEAFGVGLQRRRFAVINDPSLVENDRAWRERQRDAAVLFHQDDRKRAGD